MSLVIPAGRANWTIKLTNSAGGASAQSGWSLATDNLSALDQTIVNRVANLFRDNFKTLWDSAFTIGPVHVLENNGGTLLSWDDTTTEVCTGAAGVYSAPSLAYVVSKRTGLAGRQQRGRFYLPAVAESGVDEAGIIDAPTVAAVQAAVNAVYTAINADAAIDTLCLLHDSSSPSAGTSTTITSFLARNVVGSMRPRQRR